MYLVKWKNYDEKDNTWEKEEDIFSQELIDDYWRRNEEKQREKPKRGKRTTSNDSETGTKAKQRRTSITASNTKKSRRRLVQRGYSDSPSPSSSSSGNEGVNNEKGGKDNTPVITRDITDKPLEGYGWSDAKNISHIYIDTAGNLLAKITWPNGGDTYTATNLIRSTAPNLLLDFYEAHLKFGPVDKNE
ncbi:hypothetical protein BDA99DRAFT_255364 [Phascolomyces articulosus]|uniref:Chromo domain-containing protein n=1 Tax=Phascolomyces articulosus TaxID=60185 RepID=A0AAD5P9Z8_9FUNG|nr:hypothetical protein BDA99DRAFT_255364 [Phascolomyces articulosus]